ncbi:MAG: hypothetical protein ABSE46_14955 [Terracidiphilus sp.]|jgi:hypothetical protein
MVHPVNFPFLIGGFVLFLAVALAIGLVLGNRRKRAAEFKNYFCSGFERDFLSSNSFDEDETFSGNHPQFTPIRIRSFSAKERRAGLSASRQDHE